MSSFLIRCIIKRLRYASFPMHCRVIVAKSLSFFFFPARFTKLLHRRADIQSYSESNKIRLLRELM